MTTLKDLRLRLKWAQRGVALLEQTGNDPGALAYAHAECARLQAEIGLIEPEVIIPATSYKDWTVTHQYGQATFKDELATITIDTADDIIATGTDEDIKRLRHIILNNGCVPVCDNITGPALDRMYMILATANWIDTGYSKFRNIEVIKRSW